ARYRLRERGGRRDAAQVRRRFPRLYRVLHRLLDQVGGFAAGAALRAQVEPPEQHRGRQDQRRGIAWLRPAMSGAVPCTACAMAWSSPALSEGASPIPPASPEAWSDRMSPNRLVVAT